MMNVERLINIELSIKERSLIIASLILVSIDEEVLGC